MPALTTQKFETQREVVLNERDALETLMRNCEDAYGFPPYQEIEGFLPNAALRVNGAETSVSELLWPGRPVLIVLDGAVRSLDLLVDDSDGFR